MQINKKFFLLLLSVPMYASYLYIGSLFLEVSFLPGEIICFSVFAAAATVLLVFKDKRIHLLGFLILHIALFLLFKFYDNPDNHITESQLQIYFFYCFPALLLLEALTGEQETFEKKKRKKVQQNKTPMGMLLVFSVVLILLLIVFFFRLFDGSKGIFTVFDGTVMCFLLILIFLVFCIQRLAKTNARGKSIGFLYLIMLCLLTVFSGLTYYLCMNQYVSNPVQVTFPLFLAVVIFFEKYPAIRETVFRFAS